MARTTITPDPTSDQIKPETIYKVYGRTDKFSKPIFMGVATGEGALKMLAEEARPDLLFFDPTNRKEL